MSPLRILSIFILSILAPIGILANLSLLIIIWKLKRLHNCANIIFAHLATADFLVCTIGTSMGLAVYFTKDFIFCKGAILAAILCYGLSTETICLLTYDRFVYISRPLTYHQRMTFKKVRAFFITMWILRILNSLPIFTDLAFTSERGEFYHKNMENCVMTRILNRSYSNWICITVLLPAVVTITMNLRILALARLQSRKIEDLEKCSHRKFSKMKRKRAYRIISYIVCVNILCSFPYLVLVMVETFSSIHFPYTKIKYGYALYLLNYLNCVLDPFVYSYTNSDIKRALRKYFVLNKSASVADFFSTKF